MTVHHFIRKLSSKFLAMIAKMFVATGLIWYAALQAVGVSE